MKEKEVKKKKEKGDEATISLLSCDMDLETSFQLKLIQGLYWPGKSTTENPHLKPKVSYLRGQDLLILHKSTIPVSLHNCIHAEKLMLSEHCFP